MILVSIYAEDPYGNPQPLAKALFEATELSGMESLRLTTELFGRVYKRDNPFCAQVRDPSFVEILKLSCKACNVTLQIDEAE